MGRRACQDELFLSILLHDEGIFKRLGARHNNGCFFMWNKFNGYYEIPSISRVTHDRDGKTGLLW